MRRFADADIVVSLPVKKVVTAGQTVIGDFILRVAVTIQIIIGKSVHFRGGVFAQRTNAFGGKNGAFFNGQLVQRNVAESEINRLFQFLLPVGKILPGAG